MHDANLTLAQKRAHRETPQAMSALRTALALSCAAVALAGCGGGSDSSPVETPTPLAAPENFTVGSFAFFSWKATPEATRYELFTDPDGPGPQPEARMGDAEGFTYSSFNQQFNGSLTTGRYRYADFINATYRLRACNTTGCGAFTAAQVFDIAKSISYEFPTGRSPLKTSVGNTSLESLSRDGLTLAVALDNLYIFARSSTAHPWQQQAMFSSRATRLVLSADGNTLAVSGFFNADAPPVQVYQRSNATWSLQTTVDATQTPPACTQPCKVIADNTALSADGNVLAVTGRSGSAGSDTNAVFTYLRTGTAWAPQSYLAPAATPVGSAMALSGDGRTLAVNGGAFTRTQFTTPPYLYVYVQSPEGAWSEQARLPAGIMNFLDIAASRFSTVKLSSDGNTLAVEANHLPGNQPAEFNIGTGDLTCGSTEPWNTAPVPAGSYSNAAWHIAVFARDGSANWRRQAVMARSGVQWALATDGNALFYGGSLFTRSSGTWACP